MSPSAHMASLGGPLERERRTEGVLNPPIHPHITESAPPAFCKDFCKCSVPGSDCEGTHQPNSQHGEAVRPYLGKLSHFSAAALAACGSLRRVPSQPTPPSTRRSSSGSVTPVLAPPTMPSSPAHGHHPLLGCPLCPGTALGKEVGDTQMATTWTGIRLEMSTISSTLA